MKTLVVFIIFNIG